MAFLEFKNVTIKGLSACVPETKDENLSSKVFSGLDEARTFMSSTGVERKRLADKNTTASDLCYKAADKLINDLNWERESVECLILVTQTADYILPASSCILQQRLGLPEECYTMDISLGCSGWVYGLSVLAGLMSGGGIKRGLLLAGETAHKPSSPQDKSTWPLFGDAGTATAVIYEPGSDGMKFHFGTDGDGYEAIIIPDGGFRNPFSEASLQVVEIEPGVSRSRMHAILNGMDVFSFGISKAPQSINKLLDKHGLNKEEIDYYIFHQANKFMNETIRKKLKLPSDKVPYSLANFGNTSSASIPLTMVTELAEQLKKDEVVRQIGCGFGVGLSWATVYFETKKLFISDLVEI